MEQLGASTTAREVDRTPADLLRGPALVGLVGAGAATLLHLHDPHDSGSYGYCPFLALTGRPCPGCGGLRAINDLTRGDLLGAASSNVLAVVLVVVLAMAWCVWVVRLVTGRPGRVQIPSARVGLALVAILVVFGVVRNTPWGSWLAP